MSSNQPGKTVAIVLHGLRDDQGNVLYNDPQNTVGGGTTDGAGGVTSDYKVPGDHPPGATYEVIAKFYASQSDYSSGRSPYLTCSTTFTTT